MNSSCANLMYRFRWAACQLDALEEYEMPHDLLQALESLPDTLDETYRRILEGIPQIHLSNSIRILQFLTYTERPITIEEAVDILATTPESNPKFDKGNRMPNPQGILKFCMGLVTISEDEDEGVIRLAHFSVKEYLASPGNKGPFGHELNEARAHESITQVLLAYMSSLHDWKSWYDNEMGMIQSFPLAAYGARYWTEHARQAEQDDRIRESILEFYECQEAWFICISIYDPEGRDRFSGSFQDEVPEDTLPLLYVACMSGLQQVVKDLLLGDPDSIDVISNGYYGSALRVACHYHHMNVVKILLDNGADVDLICGYDEDVNYSTALMTAIEEEHDDLVELLLEHGADPNVEGLYLEKDTLDEVKSCPLILASLKGSERWTSMLLSSGAQPCKTDVFGESALSYACRNGHYRIARSLLSKNAPVDEQNHTGETPFHAACQSGHDEIIRLLIGRAGAGNAKISVSGGKYGNALQTASYWGRIDAVEILLHCGADTGHVEGKYGPALHSASARGHLRVVELLLRAGADPHLLDCHQWTAVFLAIKNGHEDVSNLLWQVSGNGPLFRCLYPSTFIQLNEEQDMDISQTDQTLSTGNYTSSHTSYLRTKQVFCRGAVPPRLSTSSIRPSFCRYSAADLLSDQNTWIKGKRVGSQCHAYVSKLINDYQET